MTKNFVSKPSNQEISKYNRIALKKYIDLKVKYTPILNYEGMVSVFRGVDSIGYYCIAQCNCCNKKNVCRVCKTEVDREKCKSKYNPP